MVFLILMGMRIAFVAPLVAFGGITALKGWKVAFNLAGYLPHGIASHYFLSVIPLFIIMGYLGFHSGLTKDIFYTARQWFGVIVVKMDEVCLITPPVGLMCMWSTAWHRISLPRPSSGGLYRFYA